MSACRCYRYALAASGLGLLAVVLGLPVDSGRAAPRPAALGSDLAVLPGDCALFVTLRPADFAKDPLAQAISNGAGIHKGMERDFGKSLADLERITFTVVAGGTVEIIRTSKRFDRKKLLADLRRRSPIPRPRNKGFEKKKFEKKDRECETKDRGDAEEKPEVKQKKFGARVLYYFGERSRWTPGLCFVGDNVLLRGNANTLEALLSSKTKRSTALTDMLRSASEHSLVAGFQGKPLRALLRRKFRDMRRGYRRNEPSRVKEKEEKDTDLVLPPNEALALAPYKPLLMMQTALIAVDLKKGYTAHGRITFPTREAADDGETAARTMLYVLRELAAGLTKYEDQMRALAPLAEPARKALKGAKIKRTGNTLETTLRLEAVSADTLAKIRSELARTAASNNFKLLALAFHNHASANNDAFPAQANYDKGGKALLSWRVHILPYIEQDALYRQFKLNEPWDSKHNKKLLAKMPSTFALPGTKAKAGETFIQAFAGKEAMFEGKRAPNLKSTFQDGTSNTILLAEAARAVPWTKPEDLPYDPKKPLPKVGGHFPGGFLVAMCDGSVRFVKNSVTKKTLRAAITPAGGEVLGPDW